MCAFSDMTVTTSYKFDCDWPLLYVNSSPEAADLHFAVFRDEEMPCNFYSSFFRQTVKTSL